MKAYVHNPDLYREHYRNQVGAGLPGFQGGRTQHVYGFGTLLGSLARKAVPLLASGAKLIAPHLKQAFKGIAKDVTGKVVQSVTTKRLNTQKRKKPRKSVSRRKKAKVSTSKDIF